MRGVSRLAVKERLSLFVCHRQRCKFVGFSRCLSSSALPDEYTDEPQYPPVKPIYPPGRWGKMESEIAWKWHEKGDELLQKSDPRERLESFCGEEDDCLWYLRLFDQSTRNLIFKQAVTKSIIENRLPNVYSTLDVTPICNVLQSFVTERLSQADDEYKHKVKMMKRSDKEMFMDKAYLAQRTISNTLYPLIDLLATKYSYVRRAQVDENVRVVSYWWKGGYDGISVWRKKFNDTFLKFHVDTEVDFQLRTELPLQEFVPIDDSLCQTQDVPDVDGYIPGAWGITKQYQRPTSISGYWIGDPSEFTQLGIYKYGHQYYKMKENKGSVPPEMITCAGLLSSFNSCVAQAHNQGFGVYHELTYPFTTQTIVTDGQTMNFFAFQLNTLQLWKNPDANPYCNILWQSEPMKLYDVIENGEVKGFNKEAFEMMIKFLLNAPCDRGISLRPNLPDWETPGKKKVLINFKGDAPLEMPEIGRFQYPRNSLYFSNCVW